MKKEFVRKSKLSSVTKIICPADKMPIIITSFFDETTAESLSKTKQSQFLNILLVELQLAYYLIKVYLDVLRDFTDEEVAQVFVKGDTYKDKLSFFLKAKNKANVSDADINLIAIRLHRRGIRAKNIMDFIVYKKMITSSNDDTMEKNNLYKNYHNDPNMLAVIMKNNKDLELKDKKKDIPVLEIGAMKINGIDINLDSGNEDEIFDDISALSNRNKESLNRLAKIENKDSLTVLPKKPEDFNETKKISMPKPAIQPQPIDSQSKTDALDNTLNLNYNNMINTNQNRPYEGSPTKSSWKDQRESTLSQTMQGQMRAYGLPPKVDTDEPGDKSNTSILGSFIQGGVDDKIRKHPINFKEQQEKEMKKKEQELKKKEKDNSFINFSRESIDQDNNSVDTEFNTQEQNTLLNESQYQLDPKNGIPVNESVSRLSKFKSKRKTGATRKGKEEPKQVKKTREKSSNKGVTKKSNTKTGKSKTPVKRSKSKTMAEPRTPKKNIDKSGIKRTKTMTTNRPGKSGKTPVKRTNTMVSKTPKNKVAGPRKSKMGDKLPLKGKGPVKDPKKNFKSKRSTIVEPKTKKTNTRGTKSPITRKGTKTGRQTKQPAKRKARQVESEDEFSVSEELLSDSVRSELSNISIINKKYGDGNYIDDILRKCTLKYGIHRGYAKVPYSSKLFVKKTLIEVLNDIIENKLVDKPNKTRAFTKPAKNVRNLGMLNQFIKGPSYKNDFSTNQGKRTTLPLNRLPAQSVILPKTTQQRHRKTEFDLEKSLIKNFMYDQKDEMLPTDNILADLDKSLVKSKRHDMNKSFNIINQRPKNELNKSINIISYAPKKNLNKSINIINYNPKKSSKRSTGTFSVLNPSEPSKSERKMQNHNIVSMKATKKEGYDIQGQNPMIFNSERQNIKAKPFNTNFINQYQLKDDDQKKSFLDEFGATQTQNQLNHITDSDFGGIKLSDNNSPLSNINNNVKFTKHKSTVEQPNDDDRSQCEIMKLNDALSDKSNVMEHTRTMLNMFKKIIVYSSKIEDLKQSIFEKNPDFNIVSIFELYDEDHNGELTQEEFTDLTMDIGIKLSDKKLQKLIYYLKGTNPGNRKRSLTFAEFINLFYPFSMDNTYVHELYYNNQEKRRQNEMSYDEDGVVIQEEDFLTMRSILTLLIKKLDDITKMIHSLQNEDLKILYYIITGGRKTDITWKILDDFFEQHDITFIEEDLVHVFRVMNSKNYATISFTDFEAFFDHASWRLK